MHNLSSIHTITLSQSCWSIPTMSVQTNRSQCGKEFSQTFFFRHKCACYWLACWDTIVHTVDCDGHRNGECLLGLTFFFLIRSVLCRLKREVKDSRDMLLTPRPLAVVRDTRWQRLVARLTSAATKALVGRRAEVLCVFCVCDYLRGSMFFSSDVCDYYGSWGLRNGIGALLARSTWDCHSLATVLTDLRVCMQ